MINPFKEDAEPHPIMGYMSKLENDVRVLKWKLTCHRFGSFISGFTVGLATGIGITIVIIRGLK
jgi:hypothetical protein